MDPSNPTPTEAELESFRRQWREEVQARSRPRAGPSGSAPTPNASTSRSHLPKRRAAPAIPSKALDGPADEDEDEDEADDTVPQPKNQIEQTEAGQKAESRSTKKKVPESALDHYEEAVKSEGQGKLGDSVNLYRKAFRLDSAVQDHYKKKHFPPSAFPAPKPANPNPSNAPVTVPNTAHHSLQGLPPSITDLVSDFSKLSIPGEEAPTDMSPPPPCPIATLPEELLADILVYVAVSDVASFARLSQVCKRFAYLVMTEERVWRRVAVGREYGFAAMHWRWACEFDGKPLQHAYGRSLRGPVDPEFEDEEITARRDDLALASAALHAQTLMPTPYPTYRALFRSRPRIRFNGCYISTVNYTRPGASSSNTLNWTSPVLIVTYYRYLRFFRDGTVISLLTTAEPHDVVSHLTREHAHAGHHGSLLPQAVMKDALKGRWRLSGKPPKLERELAEETSSESGADAALGDEEGDANEQDEEEEEEEGTVHIETEGVTPKYIYKMALAMGSAGRGVRNNRLAWKGYWSYNRLTDDWAEFGLKNDRAFYWSRVKSWGKGF